jgi:hypothetical protein
MVTVRFSLCVVPPTDETRRCRPVGPAGRGRPITNERIGKRLVFEQQVFVEGPERPVGVGDGDLQHPEVRAGPELDVGQRPVVVGRMGIVGEAVTGEVEVQLPPEALGGGDGEVVEVVAGRPVGEPLVADGVPDGPDILFGPVVLGVGADHEGVAGVALTALVDGTDVHEEDVVGPEDDSRLRPLHEVLGGVRPEAHDDVVPAPAHAQAGEDLAGPGLGVLFGHAHLHLVGDHAHRRPGAGPHLHQLVEGELVSGGFQVREHGHGEASVRS